MNKIGRNDRCPCGSGKKYKKCCMLKEAKPMNPTAKRESLASEEEKEKVFRLLFCLLRDVMNASKCDLDVNDVRQYASALATKVFRQTCTVIHLLKGSPIPFQEKDEGNWDFSSVSDLSRSIIQTYLVFHHIFVDSEYEEEIQFKYFAWIKDSLQKRKELYPYHVYESLKEIEGIEGELVNVDAVMANDEREVKKIESEMENNPFYKNLTQPTEDPEIKKKQQRYKERLKEGWLPSHWKDLQEKIPQLHRMNVHQNLSQIAHCHYLHMRKIVFARTKAEQLAECKFSISILMVVLARLIFEYADVYPQTIEVLKKEENIEAIAIAHALLKHGGDHGMKR